MKKILFSAAIAALAMSSCSNDENLGQNGLDGAIAFDVYTARTANRAQTALTPAQQQSITTDVLKGCTEGFGVYAYETGAQKFRSYLANNTYPTFMFNQQVTYDPSAPDTEVQWKYNPVKYWPNDDSHVTFQAYAPYKKNKEVLFDVKYNGVGIRYGVDEAYDLLWGAQGYDGPQAVCFYDQQKPGILDKTKFMFKHALSKVDFTVSYNADKMDCTTPDGLLDPNTEIVIRSIKLLGTLPSQGVLSLYDGSWTVEKVVENKFEYDTDFFAYTDEIGNLSPLDGELDKEKAGILTHDINKLYANQSIMLIPAKTDVKLEISYDVVTKDANGFPGHTKNITVVSDDIPTYWGNTHAGETGTAYIDPVTGQPNHNAGAGQEDKPGIFTFDAGKWTTINIHLGMTSVKLDAEVKEWITDESGSIDMPANRHITRVETVADLQKALDDGYNDIVLTVPPTTDPEPFQIPNTFANTNGTNNFLNIELPASDKTFTFEYKNTGSAQHPANIYIDSPTGANVLTNTPQSHVVLTGKYTNVDAATNSTTLVVEEGAEINGTLTVREGGVEIYGPVANLAVSPTAGKTVVVRDCKGLNNAVYDVAKKYLAPLYEGEQQADGTWNIAKVVRATIGSTQYRTLQEAMNAAKAGDVLTLQEDLENIGNLSLKANMTLEGNGYTLSGNSAVNIDPEGGTVQNVKFANIHNPEIGKDNSKTGLSAIYAKKLAGTAVVKDCQIDNCDWDAIQMTPVAGATVKILNNRFSNDDKDGIMQHRFIHIQSAKNVDFAVTINENVMLGKLLKEEDGAMECYYFTDLSKVDFTKNYCDRPDGNWLLMGNGTDVKYLQYPCYANPEKTKLYTPEK